ncbi:MAG: SdrD B-like domain-containing protein [Ignavibacteriaceae bacterium]
MLSSFTRLLNLVIILVIAAGLSVKTLASAGDDKRTLKTYGAEYFKNDNVQGLSIAKVFNSYKGEEVKFKDPVDNSNLESFAGTFTGEVDGNSAKFYCIDLQHPLAKWTFAQPHLYTDSGSTPSKITYILNNYYPLKSYPYSGSLNSEEKEASAIQLAIWHFSDNVDPSHITHANTTTGTQIRNRVIQIVADANANAGSTVPVPTLSFIPLTQTNHITVPASFKVKAVDQNNNPLAGIQVQFTTTSGTLSSTSAVTNAQGETPAITLTKGSSDNAAVTAVANVIIPQGTRYVHKIEPNKYQKLVLATPTSAMKSTEGSCTWVNYKPITPILECVTNNGDGTFTANFGYLNENNFEVTIPVGNDNKFSPAPQDRGQTTVFQPGRSPFFPNQAYEVTFNGNTIEWSLKGPDGVTRKVTASSESESCTEVIYFQKIWLDNDSTVISGKPLNLPSNYKITVTSSLGSAVGTYTGSVLNFTYTNNNGSTNGLLVDINGEYTVTEENLPPHYAAIAGTGTFVAELPGGYAVNPYNGSDKAGLHKIVNKESLPEYGSLGDKVWIDTNKNGIQDSGEPGLKEVTVELYTCEGQWLGWTLTDNNGNYLFDSLQAGSYFVKFYLIDNNANYQFTIKDAGSDNAKDSDADTSGKTICIDLEAGENDLTWDAGVIEKAPELCAIGNKVWNDINKDGKQDNSEPGVPGVTLKLYTCANELVATQSTDSEGNYLFTDVAAGDYYLKVSVPTGWGLTLMDAGTDDLLDSDADPLSSKTACFNIDPPNCDSNATRWDIGLYEHPTKGKVGDRVWLDVNKNGIQDNSEAGVSGITVKLYNCEDALLRTTVTNGNGLYLFDSLDAGSYYVKFMLPDGYEFSPVDAVSDDYADSDADVTLGRTVCFTLDAGEADLTWDAGISEIVIPVNGSIGDFVWKDSNKNGIQDEGEPGVSNVTVKLYNCDNTLVGTTITNTVGNYLFSELEAGSYYVQFILPDGYTFTSRDQGSDDQEDSDADAASGKTECFVLGAGVDDLSRDAGLQIVSGPELWINKDDYKTVMPEVNNELTYTIKYQNKGGSPAYKVAIEDVLPEGTEYVSCEGGSSCGETWNGSNVVKWNIGTLAAGQAGQVKITVKVVDFHSEYENVACITGQDTYKNPFQACDNDVNIADSCSGGGDGGVESRGDMAELLLKRKLKIQYGLTTPLVAKSKGNSSIAQIGLNAFVPEVGPFNSVPVETTPFDILGISNAIASYAVDYNANIETGNTRVAGIFSTLTSAPFIYDHTKQVCDRLAGSEIDDLFLTVINGYKFYTGKLVNPEGLTDYSITFSVYETTNGFKVENKWTYDEYTAPAGAVNVYNFQVWSSTVEGTVKMVKDVFAKFKTLGSVSFMNNSQPAPNIFLRKARYSHDGNVYLTVTNNYSPVQSSIKVKYKESQGGEMLEAAESFNIPSGTSVVKFPLGVISDAQVFLSQSSANFRDEAYVSGGAFAYLTGSESAVNTFNTNYVKQDLASYPSGALVLSGGAEVSGELKDWVSVVRSLTAGASAYDLTYHNSLRFDARGKGKVDVIIDLTTLEGYNYFMYTIDLTENMNTYEIDFKNFAQRYGTQVPFDASKIRNIGFVYNSASNPSITSFNFEVTNIAFLTDGLTDVEGENNLLPKEFALDQNYPNPFNPSTIINFDVAKKENIALRVYNVIGEQIMELVNSELEPGRHSVKFDASNLSSGIYFYKLQGNSVNITKKMILAK